MTRANLTALAALGEELDLVGKTDAGPLWRLTLLMD
jgi:hypothetical protein